MHPAPPAPPPRAVPGNYHFYAYDYPGSAAQGPWGLSLAQPQHGGLQFYSMVRDLAGLRDWGAHIGVPNIALTNVGAPTAGGRRTKMLSFGNAGNAGGRPTIFITGGIHAREWIAPAVVYLIAEYLVRNYAPVLAPPNPRQARLRTLVDTRNIRIIPMLNPDGNNTTVFGPGANDRLWRKNRRRLPQLGLTWVARLWHTPPFVNVGLTGGPSSHARYDVPDYAPPAIPPGAPAYQHRVLPNGEIGVDLNRNMATTAWGYDCAPYDNWDPALSTFFGTGPGTERETSNVEVAMNAAAAGAGGNIPVTLDYHSYSELILYPGEAGYAGAITPLHQATGRLLQALITDAAGAAQYQLGAPLALAHYNATGTVADYAAEQHMARSFTIELDPLPGGAGFQLPENQIQGVFEGNIRGALAAIAVPATVVQALLLQASLAWNVFGQGNTVP